MADYGPSCLDFMDDDGKSDDSSIGDVAPSHRPSRECAMTDAPEWPPGESRRTNLAFDGSSGKGHSRSPSDEPLEGPASDKTTTSSHGDTTGSATVSASSSDGISTTTFAWDAAGRPNSIPATLPSGAFGSDGKDRSCSPPPGKIGSSLSLVSSTATAEEGATNVTSTIGTGIAANTDAAAAALSAPSGGGNTPRREGLAAATLLPPSLAATCCSVGLQTSYMGVRVMLNPDIPRSLTKIVATTGKASFGCKSVIGTGSVAARAPVRSSDRPAHSAAPATDDDGTDATAKGRGDHDRFIAHSPMTSALAACFLDAGTAARRVASCSPPVDVTVGPQRSTEVTMTSRLSSLSEKTMSSKSVEGSSDASSNSTSLLRSPALMRRATSFFFSSFCRTSSVLFVFRASAASF
ncbi:uncharacterized protein [Miscanthus floridulus]|uniref:uncharacterized protein n=1 Tax=Miscanthus floridulus TaxID=154761 RepID=UPI00345759C9